MVDDIGNLRRCQAIKSNGRRCERVVGASQNYCYSHDQGRAEERKANASKAARSKQGSEIVELKRKLRELYDDTRSGKIPTNVGQVCGTIAGVWLKILDTEIRERECRVKELEFEQIKLPEFREVESRVAELEHLLEQQEGRYAG